MCIKIVLFLRIMIGLEKNNAIFLMIRNENISEISYILGFKCKNLSTKWEYVVKSGKKNCTFAINQIKMSES